MKIIYAFTEIELEQLIEKKIHEILKATGPSTQRTLSIAQAKAKFQSLNFNRQKHGYNSIKRMIEEGTLQTLPGKPNRILEDSLNAYINEKLH